METGVSIESPIGALSTIEPRIAAKGATKSSGAVVTHIIANMVAIAKMFFIAVFIVDILFLLQRVRSMSNQGILRTTSAQLHGTYQILPPPPWGDSFSGYFADTFAGYYCP